MPNQPLAFGMLLSGGVLVTAALTGSKISDVVAGKAGPFKGFGTAMSGGTSAAANPPPADTGNAGTGSLTGRPLDRAGVPTVKEVLDFVRKISGIYGKPITLGTGSAHSQYTTSNNVSAHWYGRAIDLPATGDALTAMGRAALVAAGMPAEEARTASGGIYNVGGWQIIFNTTEGGNHWNHLHVGMRG